MVHDSVVCAQCITVSDKGSLKLIWYHHEVVCTISEIYYDATLDAFL